MDKTTKLEKSETSETHHAESLARTIPLVRGESAEAVRQTYSQLSSQEERDAFWSEWLDTLDRTAAHGWRGLYEALNLLRESDYWSRHGYESFEEFWKDQGRFPFEQLLNLEHTYHFAKAACPDLFDVSYDAAESALKSVFSKKDGQRKNGKASQKNRDGYIVFDWDEIIAELREFGVPDEIIAQVETARRCRKYNRIDKGERHPDNILNRPIRRSLGKFSHSRQAQALKGSVQVVAPTHLGPGEDLPL